MSYQLDPADICTADMVAAITAAAGAGTFNDVLADIHAGATIDAAERLPISARDEFPQTDTAAPVIKVSGYPSMDGIREPYRREVEQLDTFAVRVTVEASCSADDVALQKKLRALSHQIAAERNQLRPCTNLKAATLRAVKVVERMHVDRIYHGVFMSVRDFVLEVRD